MEIAINLVIIAHVVVSLLLVLVILMQRPKQEGLGAAFGSGMTDAAWGARTTDVLQKGTVYLGTLFFLLSLTLGILTGKANSVKDYASDGASKKEAPAEGPATPITPVTPTPTPVTPTPTPVTPVPTPVTPTPATPAGGTTPAPTPAEAPAPSPAPAPAPTPAETPTPAKTPVPESTGESTDAPEPPAEPAESSETPAGTTGE